MRPTTRGSMSKRREYMWSKVERSCLSFDSIVFQTDLNEGCSFWIGPSESSDGRLIPSGWNGFPGVDVEMLQQSYRPR